MKHIPVLLKEVLDALGDIKNRTVVDCTFGAGGYSRAFLEHVAKVIAFDRDTNVMEDANKLHNKYGEKFRFINAPFAEIKQLASDDFDDIVFDLGISSMQIDNAERGFSFRFDAPLDMLMDAKNGITAANLIKNTSVDELANILYEYGDIKKSHMFAKLLKNKQPLTTFQLRDLINNPKDIAPIFQALRMAVNDEMGQLKSALDSANKLLRPGGKCICVTFHSVEDRIVKNTFKQWVDVSGDPRIPSIAEKQYKTIKSLTPSAAELENNPRARSAHMRGVEKL